MKNEPENNFKEASNYSPEELKQFREIFAADLKQNQAIERRYANSILILFSTGFAAVVCSYLLFQPPTKWLFGAGIFLVAIGIISIAIAAFSLQKKLKCPACHNSFLGEIGEYCPECGSASLEPPNWLGARHCNSCGKNLLGGKNRSFKYKACTHCGVFLDDKGL
jgi:RNA polymerase subunit RPABC4/transcription elongation factor Spt4